MKPVALASVVFAAALGAQSVSPLAYTSCEAPSVNALPFGAVNVPVRYVQVHDDVPAMTVRGMAFRHNAAAAAQPGYSLTMDAWLSTATTTAATVNPNFDGNHGNDKVHVIVNRTYNVPPSDPFDLPGRFVVDFPFDVPFVYGGSGSLCWEVQITARVQSVTVSYDFAAAGNTTASIAGSRPGSGCLSSGLASALELQPQAAVNWPVTAILVLQCSNMRPNGTGFVTHGFSHTSWNGTPLPAAIPTSTGAPSGTCTVYAEVRFANLITADASGFSSYQFAFTPNNALFGMSLDSQLWCLDPSANPFGVTTSNLAIHNLVAPLGAMPVGRVYLLGSLGAAGTFSPNGLVTRFH